jgi:hypothetical protein
MLIFGGAALILLRLPLKTQHKSSKLRDEYLNTYSSDPRYMEKKQAYKNYCASREYRIGEWCDDAIGTKIVLSMIAIVCALVFIIMTGIIIYTHTHEDIAIAEYEAEYVALVYQLNEGKDATLYENDNDLGKSTLMEDIKQWNIMVARQKAAIDNPWENIFYSREVVDSLKPIPLS